VVTVTVKLGLGGGVALPFSSAAQAAPQTPTNKQTIQTVFFMIDPQTQDGREFIGEHKIQRYESPMLSNEHLLTYQGLFVVDRSLAPSTTDGTAMPLPSSMPTLQARSSLCVTGSLLAFHRFGMSAVQTLFMQLFLFQIKDEIVFNY
jgi:hypothetical protein